MREGRNESKVRVKDKRWWKGIAFSLLSAFFCAEQVGLVPRHLFIHCYENLFVS